MIKSTVHDGQSLSVLTPPVLAEIADERDRAFVTACLYGAIRNYYSLQATLHALLQRPLKGKDADIEALLISGLFQIVHMGIPSHAAVSASVDAAKEMKKEWACALVNAILRKASRTHSTYETPPCEQTRFEHPQWMIDRVRQDWPKDWSNILRSNNTRAPMSLRVNFSRTNVENYLSVLSDAGIEASPSQHSPVCVTLAEPSPVHSLPKFKNGWVSVQDEGAQLAVQLIRPRKESRILDACAAPGGKTCHILESAGRDTRLTAVDISAVRMRRVQENLHRLGLDCITKVADAGKPSEWWDGLPFDCILLDAPCTSTGVIRRQPDVRLHRRLEDITNSALEQNRLLTAVWPLLASGGRLLYSTCSVIHAENDDIVASFLKTNPDAKMEPLSVTWGREMRYGRQLLPGEEGTDGFYYSMLFKRPVG